MQQWQSYLKRLFAFRDWRIGTKLIVTMLLIALVPVSVTSALANRTLGNSLNDAEARALHEEANGVGREYEGLIARYQLFVSYTATTPAIINYMAAPDAATRTNLQAPVQAQLNLLRLQDAAVSSTGIMAADGTWLAESAAPGVANGARKSAVPTWPPENQVRSDLR